MPTKNQNRIAASWAPLSKRLERGLQARKAVDQKVETACGGRSQNASSGSAA